MWIPVYDTLPRHPKLLRLAGRLRINPAQAAGHLTFLWLWAMTYSPTGDLSSLAPAEISAAAGYPGDADGFAKALTEIGWMDENGQLHDWGRYGGKVASGSQKKAEGNAARQQRYRDSRNALRNALRNGDSNASVTQSNALRLDKEKDIENTPPVAPQDETPVDPPKGWPTSYEAARAETGTVGVDAETAGKAWLKACCRGWRDAKDVPLRCSWAQYLALEATYTRERQARQTAEKPQGGPAAAQESVFALTKRKEALQERRAELRRRGTETSDGFRYANQQDRDESAKIKAAIAEIEQKLRGV